MPVAWSSFYAERTAGMYSSEIRDILHLTEKPDIISLAGGLPAPELFPVEEFRRAFEWVLSHEGATALQYGPTEGYVPLKQVLAERMAKFGIQSSPDNILITSGSQQALDLLGKLFLNPGDAIVVENPSYLGALQAFNCYQARYVIVPMDENGMRTDVLDEILASQRVKFVYALPNFQNPSGRTMSLERRQHLVRIAEKYGVPIVEDDPYGELRYEGEHLPSLKSLDRSGNVIYLGTFSKILAPGFRLGWVVAPPEVFRWLVLAKQPADLHTCTASQRAFYHVAKDGFLDRHVARIRAVYHERRDTMLRAMERHFPPEVRWTKAEGGLFVWVMLPEGVDSRELLVEAVQEKVAFVPGSAFHADGSGHNTMRLNFSNSTPAQLEEAIERLGRVIRRFLGRVAVPSP